MLISKSVEISFLMLSEHITVVFGVISMCIVEISLGISVLDSPKPDNMVFGVMSFCLTECVLWMFSKLQARRHWSDFMKFCI